MNTDNRDNTVCIAELIGQLIFWIFIRIKLFIFWKRWHAAVKFLNLKTIYRPWEYCYYCKHAALHTIKQHESSEATENPEEFPEWTEEEMKASLDKILAGMTPKAVEEEADDLIRELGEEFDFEPECGDCLSKTPHKAKKHYMTVIQSNNDHFKRRNGIDIS